MSHISSINFKKSKDFQVFHNSTIRPNYAIGGELECNRKDYEALKIKQELIEKAKEAYKRTKPPKAPNFKAKSYEWSAVCNIKPDTTMQDLERLAKHFETKYGFQCYQIAIHRDEGHIDDNGLEQINHHAHLEFITLDKESGRNNYRRELITPSVLRQMQTEVAEILQMERGIDKRVSKRERIEPRKYGAMKEKEREALKQQKEKFQATIDTLEGQKDRLAENFKTANENFKTAEATIKRHNKQENAFLDEFDEFLGTDTKKMSFADSRETHKQKIKELKNENLSLKDQKTRLEQERKSWIGQGYTQEEFQKLRALAEKGKRADELEKEIQALKEAHIRELQEKERLKNELVLQNEKLETENLELKAELEYMRESLKNASKIVENQKNDVGQLESEKNDFFADFDDDLDLSIDDSAFKEAQEKLQSIRKRR